MISKDSVVVSFTIPREMKKRLEVLASLTHRSKSFYLREALNDKLDDIEDIYIADQRVADIRAGRSQSHPLEDVIRDLENSDNQKLAVLEKLAKKWRNEQPELAEGILIIDPESEELIHHIPGDRLPDPRIWSPGICAVYSDDQAWEATGYHKDGDGAENWRRLYISRDSDD